MSVRANFSPAMALLALRSILSRPRPVQYIVHRRQHYGQPHPASHPHLFGHETELNPGIRVGEFVSRRSKFAQMIREYQGTLKPIKGSTSTTNVFIKPSLINHVHELSLQLYFQFDNHLVVIPGARRSYMIDKIPYFFRQDTDLRYLTGCLQPDCVLVMEIRGEAEEKSILFTRKTDRRVRFWKETRFNDYVRIVKIIFII